ncbi:MAG: GntG family PLP-dependent aldolase [Fimbriimonadaceae bacterium]
MPSDYQANIVDLRSDTVTRPTPEMFEAMQRAALGDDVLGDEPTVTELEQLAANMLGKEAALFVPSGTMGNQIAVATHTQPGDAMIIEEEAHVLYYECGGPGVLAGVVTRTVPSHRGIMAMKDLEKAVMHRSLHTPGTSLLCIENTHNRAGGTIIPLDVLADYKALADRNGFKVHLDGARVFNASVALGVDIKAIAQHFDSVNFCLSKGLRAPVGSILTGSCDFIEHARMWRKRLGGGMRQSGLLAACGIVSLTQYVDRLAEDHSRARRFAEAVDGTPGYSIDWDTVQTNMVMVDTVGPAQPVIDALSALDVWAMPPSPNRIRCVFHADIDDVKLDRAITAFKQCAVAAA